jgi:hypothetical protein
MKQLIELWFTDKIGQRSSIDFKTISEGKKELKTGKYKHPVLDVRPIGADGDFIGGAEYWYSLQDGKIKKHK